MATLTLIQLPFLSHFHPSVSMFAARLLSQNEMPPKPDLASHSLIAFLDKFVYKNAKATSTGLRGSSIMQPLAGGDSKGVLVSSRLASNTHQPLNTEAFWRKKAEDVAVDEVFFHKYFNHVSKPKQTGKDKKAGKRAKDGDSEDEEEAGEDEIWDALVESRPEIEGDSGDDSDLEMLDLDDDSDNSSIGGGVVIEESDEEEELLSSEEDDASASVMELDEKVDEADSDLDELFEKELQTGKSDEAKTEKDAKREERKSKRRKMKNLPTFASVDDYAQMLDNDEDEDF
jgi:ribosome biogenesis protein MAK21